MKKIIALASILVAQNTMASVFIDYEDVKQAVLSGQTIHYVVNFNKCTTDNQNLADDAYFGMFTPSEVMVVNDQVISSMLHFTLNDPRYATKPVYQAVRYVLTPNNKLTLTVNILDATNYAALGKSHTLTCPLGSGAWVTNNN